MRLPTFLSILSVVAVLVQAAPKPQNAHKSTAPAAAAAPGVAKSSEAPTQASASPEAHAKIQEELNSRRARMMNYFGYYPYYSAALNPQAPAYVAPFPPQLNDFYQFPYGTIAPVYSYSSLLGADGDDSFESDDTAQHQASLTADSNELDYDEDMFSRANRRRPGKGNANRNSPIFYIRLPPTPYMFIRGLGYISNPPTIQPLPAPVNPFNYSPSPYQSPYMSLPAANPYMQQPTSPFINVPVNYVSNAKPVGVYQYPGGYTAPTGPTAAAGMRFPLNGFGTNHVNPVRQRPAYASATAAPPTSGGAFNNPDSKITHLKGPFIFNGRPEDIYLLQNLQTTPYNANFFHGYY